MTRPELRALGLVGDPVAHSLSPRMHAAAFAALGIAAEYRTVRVPAARPDAVGPALRGLAATGGGNVTLPHKETAAAELDEATEEVRATGACNCFWADPRGRLCGDNTDVGGIRATLGELAPMGLADARVLVLGAGGAARAATLACARAGAARIEIRNRDPSRTRALVTRLAAPVRDAGAELTAVGPGCEGGRLDLVIQATSLGLEPTDPLPLHLNGCDVGAALDLVYAPGGTAWARHARALGVPTADGLRVLLHQGVLSLERWLGVPPGAEAVRAMEGALR